MPWPDFQLRCTDARSLKPHGNIADEEDISDKKETEQADEPKITK